MREAEEGADDKDMKRGVMAFRPVVAPIKCAVFPLSSQAAFYPLCGQVMDALGKLNLRSVRRLVGPSVTSFHWLGCARFLHIVVYLLFVVLFF